VTELHRSISACSYQSVQWLSKNSSKINLQIVSTSKVDCRKSSNCLDVRESGPLNLGFSREQLMKRLNNLVKTAIKNFNGDVEVRVKNFIGTWSASNVLQLLLDINE
jgi:hypothetical protein